jgi:Guanine nucleotide exchange factor synembryn
MVEDQQQGEKKIMGEQWNEKFEPCVASSHSSSTKNSVVVFFNRLVPPLIHLFTQLPPGTPPLTAPLTHVIHALLNVPVTPYSSIFFSSPSPASSQPNSIYSKTKNGFSNGLSGLTGGIADPFQRAMSLLSSQRKSFQSRSDTPKRSTSGRTSPSRASSTEESPSPRSGRARSSSPSKRASIPAKVKSSTRSDSSPKSETTKSPSSSKSDSKPAQKESSTINGGGGGNKSNYPIVTHACALLDSTLATYWPGTIEVDAISVRSSAKMQGLNLDEIITPLVVLMARLAEDVNARIQMREWILPADLDRTQALEGRGDALGRCIRMLASVYYTRLKDAVGEWLFALCDSDALTLSTQIGYGNAAGYLFNKGIMSAPPQPPSGASSSSTSTSTNTNTAASTSSGNNNINLITGMVNREMEHDEPEMTEEEKEREAERLFVLFDRLERSGMAQNPVRKAIQEGKFSMGPFGP